MFPSVQSLAFKILPILASSATSERIFSAWVRPLKLEEVHSIHLVRIIFLKDPT